MQGDWLFWGTAAVLVVGCLGVVLAPLFRGAGRAERRASFDMQVHRDQLREVDADLARGLLGPEEAAATRLEVSRRLLAAADAEAVEAATAAAPRRLTRRAAPAMLAGLVLAAAGLYGWLGGAGPARPAARAPARRGGGRAGEAARPGRGRGDGRGARRRPGAGRRRGARPRAGGQAAAGDGDPAGRSAGPPAAGAEPRRRCSAGPRRGRRRSGCWRSSATGRRRRDFVDLAELSILAAGGYVSPEAEAALARALALDPRDPVGRYYSAVTLMQGGRPDLAYRIWSGLVAEGPPDAPWMAAARAGAADAAAAAGIAPPAAGPTAPGPTASDIDAAAQMPPTDRAAMIEGMVGQLSERLATQGGPPADWARLIRSLGVLGRRDEAAAILAEARSVHAGDAPGLAEIEAAGRDAGLAP